LQRVWQKHSEGEQIMKFGIGQSVKRVEDGRLLTGQGRFTDDLTADGMVHGLTLRSPYGHARITHIDTQAARDMPGVLAVYTGADVATYKPIPNLVPLNPATVTPRLVLNESLVRFVGDPVAFVVAETKQQARDAAEAIIIEYEELPTVTDMDSALAGSAPALWEAAPGNRAWDWQIGNGAETASALKTAKHLVKRRIIQNRVAPTSMEVRAALAIYSDADGFTLITGSQGVAGMHGQIARMMQLEPAKLRVQTFDVGGGFGMKSFVYHEYVLVLHAARDLGRPVKWAGDRSDAFLADTHGRDLISDCTLALDDQGQFLALDVHTWCNLGAYQATYGNAIQTIAGGKMMGGVYRIPAIHNRVTGVLTNTAPTDAYRGAGRPEATYITERMVDAAAHDLKIPPDELRARNLLTPAELPYHAPTGPVYDVGNFPEVLEKAKTAADWDGFAARRAESYKQGKRRGRGMCYYVEITAGGGTEETADARFPGDGTIEVAVGTQTNGQGHETAYAQVLADRLQIDMDRIKVVQGDTARLEVGGGTGGSRSLHFGGAAILVTADDILGKGKSLAAASLEVAEVDYADGIFTARGTNQTMTLFDLAEKYPQQLDRRGTYKVEKPTPTYPNGCHIAEVEIDPATGVTRVVRYDVVDDFGNLLNPMLVVGQVHGGVAQGLGQALLENMVYGDDAQLMTGSLMDYGLPRADDMPAMTFQSAPVPNPNNPLGVKGCGEAGTIGAMPAIMNAIYEALDGAWIDMPATAEKIWRLCQAATRRDAA
jgi:aerobic carbon-monoxide dehydrogenase large subunit